MKATIEALKLCCAGFPAPDLEEFVVEGELLVLVPLALGKAWFFWTT